MSKLISKNNLNILGLFILLLIYILSGIKKIISFDKTSRDINKLFIFNNLNLNISRLALILVISIWTIGSLILLYATFYNKKNLGKILSLLFIIFTFIITLYYHYPSSETQTIQFLKNLSIIGGFILIHSYFYD